MVADYIEPQTGQGACQVKHTIITALNSHRATPPSQCSRSSSAKMMAAFRCRTYLATALALKIERDRLAFHGVVSKEKHVKVHI